MRQGKVAGPGTLPGSASSCAAGIECDPLPGAATAKTGGLSRAAALPAGAGASVCAIKEGVCIDTSMGLTPLEG